MKTFFHEPALRQQLLRRSLEVVGVLLVWVVCWLGYTNVAQVRQAVVQQEATAAAQPAYLLGLSKAQADLRAHEHDIERILKLVTDPADIVSFIENIEESAAGHHVEIKVSDISEVTPQDDTGQPLLDTGPFRSIQLTVTGAGRPENLLEYLHEVEYEQRLLTFESWEVTVDPTAAVLANQVSAGREVAETAGTTNTIKTPGHLEAKIILLVHNEAYHP